MFGEQVLKGLGAAGWCIGFLAGLGGLLIVAGVLGLVMIRLSRLIWPDSQEPQENGGEAHEEAEVRGV